MTLAVTQVSVTSLSDAELASRIELGDTRAFELVMRRHNRLLYRTARSILRNDAEAEDCLQEAYLQAFRSMAGFRAEAKLSTWLTRIVINSALMIRRKNHRGHYVHLDDLMQPGETGFHLQIPDAAPNPEQHYVQRERKRVLRKAISNLRPRIRAVIEVGQLHELSMKETAKVLDISLAAAKGRFFHGRAALRRSPSLRAVAQANRESAA